MPGPAQVAMTFYISLRCQTGTPPAPHHATCHCHIPLLQSHNLSTVTPLCNRVTTCHIYLSNRVTTCRHTSLCHTQSEVWHLYWPWPLRLVKVEVGNVLKDLTSICLNNRIYANWIFCKSLKILWSHSRRWRWHSGEDSLLLLSDSVWHSDSSQPTADCPACNYCSWKNNQTFFNVFICRFADMSINDKA